MIALMMTIAFIVMLSSAHPSSGYGYNAPKETNGKILFSVGCRWYYFFLFVPGNVYKLAYEYGAAQPAPIYGN